MGWVAPVPVRAIACQAAPCPFPAGSWQVYAETRQEAGGAVPREIEQRGLKYNRLYP